jgi:hypothetical protein
MKTGYSYKLFDIITSLLATESFQNHNDRITPKSHPKNAVRIKKMSGKKRQIIFAKGAVP